jgi:hypothetical protein
VFHQPVKHPGNPVVAGDGGYTCVVRGDDSRFRMWYQTWKPSGVKGKGGDYAVAYAESEDGVRWELPKLGLVEWQGSKDNNVAWTGLTGRRASAPFLVDAPEKDRRGFRYLFLYRSTDGSHLIGSQDGIHWDRDSDVRISPIHSDTANAVVYDPRREEYVMYCRAKHVYRTFRGDVVDTGASRRVARMSSKELWTLWEDEPQTILVPDEHDGRENFHFFYGMPTRHHAGLYWGCLWPFRMNEAIHTELAWSRDGFHFDRLPDRPKLVERGPEGAWDDGMVFAGVPWVEVGDEWWLYYAGWDGPHGISERTPGIGLAKVRKEGLISLHGPSRGGVVATRKLLWPGGRLLVNADAREGVLKVRVSNAGRKVVPGFDYADCRPFTGDSVTHEVTWNDRTLDELAGQVVRLEFFLQDADLYTFRAGE